MLYSLSYRRISFNSISDKMVISAAPLKNSRTYWLEQGETERAEERRLFAPRESCGSGQGFAQNEKEKIARDERRKRSRLRGYYYIPDRTFHNF